jgi:hypothetical protein
MTFKSLAISWLAQWIVATTVVFSLGLELTAQEKSATKTTDELEEGDKEGEATREAVARAADIVGKIEVETLVGKNWVPQPMHKKPLLILSDPTRFDARGTVWAWGDKGRPAVINEIFYEPAKNKDTGFWIIVSYNASETKLKATREGRSWWIENNSTLKFKDLPGGPEPAASTGGRQRQIKSLAGKFTAHEFWDPDNSRFELRLIERPLLTYSDPDKGIVDGALFAFANGTNPEILLFLEVHADAADKSKSKFRYGVGRLSYAEIHLAYEEKEVFTEERGYNLSGPDKAHFLDTIKGAKRPPAKAD